MFSRLFRRMQGWHPLDALSKSILRSDKLGTDADSSGILRSQLSAIVESTDAFRGRVRDFDAEAIARAAKPFANTSAELIGWCGHVAASGRENRFYLSVMHGFISELAFVSELDKSFTNGDATVTAESVGVLNYQERTRNRLMPEAMPEQSLMQALKSHGGSTAFPALDVVRRTALLKLIGGSLPADYVEFISVCNGFVSDGWEFYGASGRPLFWPDGTNLFLIAEDENTLAALAFLFDSQEAQYLLLDQEAASFEPCGIDLSSAIRSFTKLLHEKS